MNKIGKKILFLVAGLLFLSSNLDAAARRQAAPKKKTEARGERKRVERKADDKKEALQCTICLEELNSMPVQATACSHTFHRQCLDEWLGRNPTCPTCRANLNPETYGLRAVQSAPRRVAHAPMRVNHVAPRHNNQAAQIIQNLPGPLRWLILCCLRCPRAPRNLARRR